MMGPDMPFAIIYPVALLAVTLTFTVLTTFRRVRYRLQIGRELRYLIGQDQYRYIIIDIRSAEDYHRGHLPNAIHVSRRDCRETLPTENMFEKIFVCGSNVRRSRRFARCLSATGYFNVAYFGSFRTWDGPLETRTERVD